MKNLLVSTAIVFTLSIGIANAQVLSLKCQATTTNSNGQYMTAYLSFTFKNLINTPTFIVSPQLITVVRTNGVVTFHRDTGVIEIDTQNGYVWNGSCVRSN